MLKQVNQTYHTLKIHYYIREIDFISPVELNVPYKLCKSKRICDIIKTGNKKNGNSFASQLYNLYDIKEKPVMIINENLRSMLASKMSRARTEEKRVIA